MKKLGIAVAILGAGMIAALAQGGKPLVVGSVGQPNRLAPGKISDGNSIMVMHQIYDSLMKFKPGTAEVMPGLATRATHNTNSTVWTFALRPNVKFHDGTAFNAEAVKFNIEYWWDDTQANFFKSGQSVVPDIFQGYKSDPKSLIKSVAVVNPLTVRVTLAQPMANFDEIMATGYFGIASPTAVKKAGQNYGTAQGGAVGTGPFVFKSWTPGDRIVLDRNANYWKGKDLPKSNGMVVRFITDAAAQVAELRAGNIDLIPTGALPPDVLPTLKNDANVSPVFRPSFNIGYLGLNTAKKPLDNLKVRQAIAAAINKKAIVEAFYGDTGITNGHLPPPSLEWAYSKKVTDYTYNPEQAKKLLADAGFKNGFEMDLWYMPVSRPYFPTAKPIAEAMAADLAAVGIKANLKTEDWSTYLDDNDAGKLQSYMLGWTGDYNDPDNFFTPLVGPGQAKATGYTNQKLYDLLNAGRVAPSKAKKADVYAQIDDLLFNDVVLIPIVHSRPLLGRRANVTGWNPGPLGSEPLDEVFVK